MSTRRATEILVVLLILGAAPTLAQEPAPDPFAPPPADHFSQDLEGALTRARIAESLALAKSALERQPADLEALRRARLLLDWNGRAPELIPFARSAVRQEGVTEIRRAALRGLLGQLLVEEADSYNDWGFVIVFIGGQLQPQQRGGTNEEALKLYREAADHLRAALRADPEDDRSRDALASALTGVLKEGEEESKEATRLEEEAEAIRLRRPVPEDRSVRLDVEAGALRLGAMQLETRTPAPDHVGALHLRRKALVLDFCTHTFAFEFEPGLYGPISRLASADLIQENLTRSFIKKDGTPGSVAPHHLAASTSKRLELVRALRLDLTPAAAAALLALVRRAFEDEAAARIAMDALLAGGHSAAREHLPAMLQAALAPNDINFTIDGFYPPVSQRLLVRLAAEMDLKEAAAPLAAALRTDEHLYATLGIAAALGRVGSEAETPSLFAVATDPTVDVHFRRAATEALGRIALAELEKEAIANDPALEVAVAAARYRHDRNESAKGRLLAALDSEHEVDDAALACAALGLLEARPALEGFLTTRESHYAAPIVREALRILGSS